MFRSCGREFQFGRLHLTERGFDILANVIRVNVAKNRQYHVTRHDVATMEFGKIGPGEFWHGRGSAERIHPVRMALKEFITHQLLRHSQNPVLLSLDFRQLHLFFADEHVIRELGVLKNVGHHLKGEIHVFAEHMRGDAKTVSAI